LLRLKYLYNKKIKMPFNSDTARQAGKKSKRGPSLKISHSVKEKLKFVLEDHLF
jgi:hypothetical protein